MSAKHSQLIASRSIVINRISETKALAQQAVENPCIRNLFKVRFPSVKALYQEFEQLHIGIIKYITSQKEPDLVAEEEVRKGVDDNYYYILSQYDVLFGQVEERSPPNVKSSVSLSTPSVRLPKLTLPDFDGDLKSWPTYRDMFISVIHHNPTLTNIERFQYLISSLKKEPLTLAKTLPMTDMNYQVVFDTLLERYNNTRNLATFYWRSIQDLPSLKEESASGLRKLLNSVVENLEALKNIGLPVAQWDFILVTILLDKLDNETRKQFELKVTSQEIPKWDILVKFLRERCQALEAWTLNSPKSLKTPISTPRSKQSFVATSSSMNSSCILCKEAHMLAKCSQFLAKCERDRYNFAKQNRYCLNCLNLSHSVSNCPSKYSCRFCKAKHHSLLHFRDSKTESPAASPQAIVSSVAPVQPSTSLSSTVNQKLTTSSSTHVLLSTVRLYVRDRHGRFQAARALIDTASQASYITSRCVQRLRLLKHRHAIPIFGIAQTTTKVSHSVTTQISSSEGSASRLSIELFVLPQICGQLPSLPLSPDLLSDVDPNQLADPLWYQPANIDILLGADVCPYILMPSTGSISQFSPAVINTIFGLILLGPISLDSIPARRIESLLCAIDTSLDLTLRYFWEVEQVPCKISEAPENIEAEHNFLSSLSRTPEGRFCVALPFKGTPPNFCGSRDIADRRLLSLEKRLLRTPDVKELYKTFMLDYLESGHMSLVSPENVPPDGYFIPHHCILKTDNSQKKIRVVFDASTKDSNQLSLNDTQLVGPKLQSDIVTAIEFPLESHCFNL